MKLMKFIIAAVCVTVTLLTGCAGVCKSNDYASALRELKLLAVEGNADAQNNVGVIYRGGWGVTINNQVAVKWFKLAAEQGNRPAQANLGFMYANGMGISQDWIYAYMWSKVSASNGFIAAKDNVKIYSKNLTARQLSLAERLITTCALKKFINC